MNSQALCLCLWECFLAYVLFVPLSIVIVCTPAIVYTDCIIYIYTVHVCDMLELAWDVIYTFITVYKSTFAAILNRILHDKLLVVQSVMGIIMQNLRVSMYLTGKTLS